MSILANTHIQGGSIFSPNFSPQVSICSPTLLKVGIEPTLNFGCSSQVVSTMDQNTAELNAIAVLEWMNSIINLDEKEAENWILKNQNLQDFFTVKLIVFMDDYLENPRDVNIQTTVKLAKFYMNFLKYSEIMTTRDSKKEIIVRKINKFLYFKVNENQFFENRLPMLPFFEKIPLSYLEQKRENFILNNGFNWDAYNSNVAFTKPDWMLPTIEKTWRSDINIFMNNLRSIIFDSNEENNLDPYEKTVNALLVLKGRIKWLNNKDKGSWWDQTVASTYRNVIHRKDFRNTEFLLNTYKCFLYSPFIGPQTKKNKLEKIVENFNTYNNF